MPQLPTPLTPPQRDVVIYDGECVFCSRQVALLTRLDGKQRLSFISLHSEFVADHFPDLSYDDLMAQMYLVPATDGQYSPDRFGGVLAVRYLTRRLPKLWLFAPLLHLPFSLPIWNWLYQQVAKRRYRLAGRSCEGTCELHLASSAKEKAASKTSS